MIFCVLKRRAQLCAPSPNPSREGRGEFGFTLVEMAVVLVIIGLLILTIFPALTALRTSSQKPLTQNNLQSLLRATASYVQANGCLPCPTPATTRGAGLGRVRGDNGAAPLPCGSCIVPEGLPPYASLGIPAATAHDAWGHWISMRVDPALTFNFAIVPPTAPCTSSDLSATTPTCVTLNASQKGLCRSGLSASNRIVVQTLNGSTTPTTQQAAVIFVSHGSSGYGSFFNIAENNSNNGSRLPFPASMPDCSSSTGYARCNADGNVFYIDAREIHDGNSPYDDMMIYADRNTLVSQFGNGSCNTVW